MSSDHAHAPYIKIFFWLGILTVAEIVWALPSVGIPRLPMILGLGAMAFVKAALVGLYYMHLKYEKRLIWGVILFPVVLAVVMIAGLLPDAIGYY
jgi:cytochrome c oxidase subunit 4